MGHLPRRALARQRYPLVEREAPGAVRAESACGESPAAAREVLDTATRAFETIMLMIRVREGLAMRELLAVHDEAQLGASLRWLVSQALIEPDALNSQAEPDPEAHVRLTLKPPTGRCGHPRAAPGGP